MADIENKAADVEKANKPDKATKAKKDKPSLGSRIAAWFRGFKAEFKKIVWVSPKNVAINTGIVLVVVVIVGAVLFGLDSLFSGAIIGLSRLVG
jgi:preprotein translocase SecE subunit